MKYREVARKLASLGCQERERRGVGDYIGVLRRGLA